MPTSASVFDHVTKKMMEICNPNKVLDIGPGAGKYGKMLREIEAERGKHIHKMCVEIDKEKIIERFNLSSIYDEIINEDASNLARKYPTLTGDIVISGDMIEHITKSEGVDLIEYLQYRFKHIFLVIPVDWLSLEWEDYEHESHISIWRPEDISRFNGAYCVQRLTKDGHKFLLASINSILIRPDEYFLVRDEKSVVNLPRYYEEGIEFGFLNR